MWCGKTSVKTRWKKVWMRSFSLEKGQSKSTAGFFVHFFKVCILSYSLGFLKVFYILQFPLSRNLPLLSVCLFPISQKPLSWIFLNFYIMLMVFNLQKTKDFLRKLYHIWAKAVKNEPKKVYLFFMTKIVIWSSEKQSRVKNIICFIAQTSHLEKFLFISYCRKYFRPI